MGCLDIPDCLPLNHGPCRKLQDFLLNPSLNWASPAFSLLLTIIPAALQACLCLSSLFTLFPPAHIYTHTFTHTPSSQSTPLLSTSRAELLPEGLSILSISPSSPCSGCLQVKLQNRGTALTHTCISLPHIFPPANILNSFSESHARFFFI